MSAYARGSNAKDQRIFGFLRRLVRPFVIGKFNFSYDDLSSIDGPYLLLANHNMDIDPVLVGIAAGRQLYFVASEHITHKKRLYKLLDGVFHPIIHTKGRLGVQSTMEIMRTLRRGGRVGLFPEGNRSFTGVTGLIPPATAKLARSSGAALVTFRIEGGYFTQPRWSLSLRRGKTVGRLINVYSPEQLRQMSTDDIYTAICDDLHEDAYQTQQREQIAFRGKAPALGMESTLFVCPRCRRIGTLSSDSQQIFCGCGFAARYDEYGLLHDEHGESHTIRDWHELQCEQLRSLYEQGGEGELFGDSVTEIAYSKAHEELSRSECRLSAERNGFRINGRLYTAEELEGMAVYSRNALVVHIKEGDKHLELRGCDSLSFNALKYIRLYELMTGCRQL